MSKLITTQTVQIIPIIDRTSIPNAIRDNLIMNHIHETKRQKTYPVHIYFDNNMRNFSYFNYTGDFYFIKVFINNNRKEVNITF